MIYGALGRRLQGKTTWMYYHARKVPQRIVFDPRRQLRAHDPRARMVATSNDLECAFDDALADPAVTEIIVVPIDDPQPVFETLCLEVRRWIEHDDRRPLAVAIDEARFVNTDGSACQWMLRCSPHDTVHIFFSAHRPSDLSVDARAIMDRVILFHTTQEHDLKVIAERCGSQVANRVRLLKPYEIIEWNDEQGKAFAHTDPRRWFIPLRDRTVEHGRTPEHGRTLMTRGETMTSEMSLYGEP